jgi:hypothetical protein
MALSDQELLERLNSVSGSSPGEGGALSSILSVLGYLDRPRNAVASGVYNLVDDDPNTGFFGGLGKGWRGERETNWTDVFGLPEPEQTDDWGAYLGKGALQLGLDALLDPLNLIPALGLGGKALNRGGRAIAGTGLGKAFSHSSWDPKAEALIRMIRREGSDFPIREAAQQTKESFESALAKYTPEEQAFIQANLREAIERPGKYSEIGEDILDPFQQLQKLNRSKFDEINNLRAQLGLKPIEAIEEEGYEYVPRMLSGEGRFRQAGLIIEPRPFEQLGRELYRWVNPENGQEFVGRAEDLEKEIRKGFLSGEFEPRQLSLREAQKVAPKRMWIEDPLEALYANTKKKQARINYLRTINEFQKEGLLTHVENIPDFRFRVDKDFKRVGVKGFEDLAGAPNIVNRLENLASALYDTDQLTGKLEQALSQTLNSKIGQAFREYTNEWKTGTLGLFPGYYLANIVSNFTLMWLSHPGALADIPEAIALKAGKGKGFKGLSNEKLLREFKIRDLVDTGQISKGMGLELPDVFAPNVKAPLVEMATRKLGTLGGAAEKAYKGWRWTNEKAMATFGVYPEEVSKLAVAIRYLKRHAKDGKVTPELLDRAAQEAKDFLFDYRPSELTTFERALRDYFPFATWFRSIMGRTLEDLAIQPQRLARLGRAIDFTFTPLTEGQQSVAPEYIKEGGPVAGLFGERFMNEEGLPILGQIGRFVPQGTVEQFTNRPGDFLLNLLNPMLKAPFEMLGNYSYFTGRPIDEAAGSGLDALLNPLTGGGAYSLNYDKSLLGHVSGVGEGGYLPAMWQHVLQSYSPVGRHLRTLDTLAEGDLFDTPSKKNMGIEQKALWYATGGKTIPFDYSRYEYYKQLKENKENQGLTRQIKRALKNGDYTRAAFYRKQLDEQVKRQQQERYAATSM